jgi:TolB-like protein/class 3 adenylate cyclase/Flp pilus assembly protein TadD
MPDARTRRLAAIMFADMVGYTSLMQSDEDEARAQRDLHRTIISAAVSGHNGRVLQYYGDGTLSIFDSAVEAVECAVAVQLKVAREPLIPLRIGIHSGDIVQDADGVYGDGVNVASRIEHLSAPGGVMISGKVFDEVKNHTSITAVPIGAVQLRKIEYRLAVFAIANDGLAVPSVQDVRDRTEKDGSDTFTAATEVTGEDGSPVPPRERGTGELFLQRVRDRAILQWGMIYTAAALVTVQTARYATELLNWTSLIHRGLALVALVGFFVTLVVAWFHGEKGRQRIQRVEVVLIAGLLIVAAAGLRLLPTSGPRGADTTALTAPIDNRPSVAVMPWANRSGVAEDAYFADGIHDEVLTRLSKISGLRVISRQSVMQFRDSPLSARQIADQLGVQYILQAGLLRVRDTVRVNVQLIDGRTEDVAWADTHDRYLTLENLLAIQAEIAQTIADTLRATVTPAEQAEMGRFETDDLLAYDFYLQGRSYYLRPGYVRADFESAQALFERAIERDPQFALARAALSRVHGQMYWEQFDPTPERLRMQREQAEEALRLQPDLPQAHLAIGWWYYVNADFQRALQEYLTARRGLPNDAEIVSMIGYTYRRLDNWSEVFAAFEEAIRLSPRDATLFYDLGGHSYIVRRQYAEAIRAYDRALSLAPDFHDAALRKADAWLHWQGRLDTMRAVIARLPQDLHAPEIDIARADLALKERDPDRLLRLLDAEPDDVFETQLVYLPKSLYAAWAHQLEGDAAAARAAFDSAAVFLEARVRERPDDARILASLGYALAGSGRIADAERMAMRTIRVAERNAITVPQATEMAARILAQAGLSAESVAQLERLLSDSSPVSINTVRVDPLYDPIRDTPEFKALVAAYRGELVPDTDPSD